MRSRYRGKRGGNGGERSGGLRAACFAWPASKAYLEHPILGLRLLECAEGVVRVEARSATAIFGTPDDLKPRSCATLFASVLPQDSVFERPSAQIRPHLGSRLEFER